MTVEGLLVGTVSGQGGCHRVPLQREGTHTGDVVVAYFSSTLRPLKGVPWIVPFSRPTVTLFALDW